MKSIILTIIVLIACGNVSYAQNSDSQKAKAAAQTFYKKYLPTFGYPYKSDLRKLRPYLSPNLYSLVANEIRRMRLWTAKNPNDKPPVIDDLFVCNHEEPAARFRVGEAILKNKTAVVTTHFDYIEKEKIYATCKTESLFVQKSGRWLLDNIAFDDDVDLKTLLSRREYDVLPQ